jgi:hypothetical protein
LPGFLRNSGTLSPPHFLKEEVCVMPNRETYRRNALQCLRAAGKANDSGERFALLSLASNFMTLAEYVDGRQDRRIAPGNGRDHDTQNDN